MSMIVLHVRWEGYGPEQHARIQEVLPTDERRPAGCLSRQWRCEPRAVLGTEVWRSEEEVQHYLTDLPPMLARAGLTQPSHLTGFALPVAYAQAYGQSARAPRQSGPLPVIPAPRAPLDDGAGLVPAAASS